MQAESDMEGVHFEKKQLLAQWKSSLNAIQRCEPHLGRPGCCLLGQDRSRWRLMRAGTSTVRRAAAKGHGS